MKRRKDKQVRKLLWYHRKEPGLLWRKAAADFVVGTLRRAGLAVGGGPPVEPDEYDDTPAPAEGSHGQ